ncbi:MAG: hypothetical protein CMM85_16130 [Rhodothermaceae bacterium]|nr:hypothetical protein [Rhodothermaceae bacterium]
MIRAVVLAALASTAPLVQAQSTDADCAATYAGFVEAGALPGTPPTITSCVALAYVVADSLDNVGLMMARAIQPRDVQPARGASGGGSGSIGQTDALAGLGIEPLVGGSLSAVGTEDGAGALATLTINPLVLTGPLDNVDRLAAQTRQFDLSLVIPVDDADRNDDGRVDYIGLRGRYNVIGAAGAKVVLDELREAYRGALDGLAVSTDSLAARITRALLASDDPTACAEHLLAADGQGCSAEFTRTPAYLYERLDAAAADVREEVDRQYLGLDLRMDYGDPTLGTTPGADGFVLGALLAGGQSFGEGGFAPSLRGHVGAIYTVRDTMDTPRLALDAALGLAFSRVYALQRIDVQVGLQGQVGVSGPDTGLDADRDRLLLSSSVNVPITGTQSASVRLALPLVGGGAVPLLSIGGNWHLPLPGRPGI